MNYLTSHLLILRALLCVTLVSIFSCSDRNIVARGQDLDNVTIGGLVIDQNGSLIPGATVIAIMVKTGVSRTTNTDDEGHYRLIQLEPGGYTVRVSAAGFESLERENLVTVAGQNVRLNLKLYPAGVIVKPVIVSTTDTPLIDTTRTVVGGTVAAREIDSLPIVTRSPLDLIFTLPGITEEPLSTRGLAEDRNTTASSAPEEAGIFALSGGAAYSNNITIDGLDNNDDRAARERFQPPLEAVEEVQVITNQFSAEYGRASGGRVNIRLRGGAKEFHGRAFYFFQDESLNANTFRNNSLGLKRLPLQHHNAGFTLGGPILLLGRQKPKQTFFFTAYELDKVLDSALIDTLVPVQQNALFPLPPPTTPAGSRLEDSTSPALKAEIAPFISSVSTPLLNNILTTRVDHKFSGVRNGVFLYQLGRLSNLRQFGAGNRLAEALQARTRKSEAISYSETLAISKTMVNQARVQFSRLRPGSEARGGVSPVVLISLNDPLAAGDPARRSGTLVAGSSTSGATQRGEDRFQLQNVLAIVLGFHVTKLGADLQRIRSTFIDLADASGTFNFASAGDFLAAVPSRFRQTFETTTTQRNTYAGIFIQDDWQVLPNLLFSYGLRYERESILRDGNDFGPRVALAYDPGKSGETVIRFGAGVFYNRALLRTIDDFTLGTRKLFFDTNALTDAATGRLLTSAQRRAFISANIRFPETLAVDSPLVRQFGVLNTGFSRGLDPELRVPQSYQANVGLERELGGGLVLETNYTWNRVIHLWREFNVNAPLLPAGYQNFADYLGSRDFPNFRNGTSGLRPLYNAANAGEFVRFVFTPLDPANPNAVGRITEFGVPISLVNLNSFTSSTSVDIALASLNELRPAPSHGEVEKLISAGNSFYHGLTVELRSRFKQNEQGFGFFFRAAYTLSHLIDDGIVNTSDALTPGDFRHERARSLLDRRHRFVFSGVFDTPRYLGRLRLAPIWRVASGAPFNISIGGADRNLDDVGNDRPNFAGDTKLLHWRRPGDRLDPAVLPMFSLPTIGRSGNLARNAGHGPALFIFDLNLTREFRMGDRMRLRATFEFDNVLNKTVFSFGSEFINFRALGPTASAEQRQAFLDSFLVTTRTLQPRQLRLGLRLEF